MHDPRIVIGRAGQNVDSSTNWNLAFISENLIDFNLFSRGGGKIFPLYLYEKPEGLFNSNESNELLKTENFNKDFRNFVNSNYETPAGEEIIGYIYAILHSPTYREKYRSFLDIDFPKIPFVDSKETFSALSKLGWKVIDAHLLKKIPSTKDFPFGTYKGKGTNEVEQRKFHENPNIEGFGKIQINSTQYFDNVPTSVWEIFIGGYQVLDKYLKDRKGRILNLEEIENIEKMIRVLRFTEAKMKEIDNLTKDWI